MDTNTLFIELLQVAIGHRDTLSHHPSDQEWAELYQKCLEQSTLGVGFSAIEKLFQTGCYIPAKLKIQWYSSRQQIEQRNLYINQRAVSLSDFFRKSGFECCLLKGQGNAQMYPNPLARVSGDIDMWVSGGKEQICEFVRSRFPSARACDWHIDFPVFKKVPVEVHFIPGYARSPKYDKRLQAYFNEHAGQQFSHWGHLQGADGQICVPTDEFNMVVQLSHVLRHFMIEGIGMRHMMDFYYLLQTSNHLKDHREEIEKQLKYLGLLNFASAVMWVMCEVFHVDEQLIIIQPNKKRGQLLLDEILMGGNFGKYDKRKTNLMSRVWKTYPFVSRALRYAWYFPEEALLTPISKRIKI